MIITHSYVSIECTVYDSSIDFPTRFFINALTPSGLVAHFANVLGVLNIWDLGFL